MFLHFSLLLSYFCPNPICLNIPLPIEHPVAFMNVCYPVLQSKQTEDLGAAEEKLDHLNKIKAKLEQTLDELEDSLQSEKKARLDLDKSRRKVEGDIKVAQEQGGDPVL